MELSQLAGPMFTLVDCLWLVSESVHVQYRYAEGWLTYTEIVSGVNKNTVMVQVNGLIAGVDYTFFVAAMNTYGLSVAECETVTHIVGR